MAEGSDEDTLWIRTQEYQVGSTFKRLVVHAREIDLALPVGCPVELHVRRHHPLDHRRIEHGTMVDLQLGDPAFDEAFLVEAAPVDVARVLLDAPMRHVLARCRDSELRITDLQDRRVLRLTLPFHDGKAHDTNDAVRAMRRIGVTLRDLYRVSEVSPEPVLAGAPYRPTLVETEPRDLRGEREREVAALLELRAVRRGTAMIVLLILVLGGIVAILVMGARSP